MQKVTPFLWFDDKAEEATHFYVSLFRNATIENISRSSDGKVMSTSFQLDGQRFLALNGGPHFKFTEAVSLYVNCETQAEVDELWERLSEGGQKQRCGWLKDRYGLSWQIIPSTLNTLLQDKDAAKSSKVMQAMLKMEKLDIAGLQQAYAGA